MTFARTGAHSPFWEQQSDPGRHGLDLAAEAARHGIPSLGVVSDPARLQSAVRHSLKRPGLWGVVQIIYSMPQVHWYLTNSPRFGQLSCCEICPAGILPFGPRGTGRLAPGNRVLVYYVEEFGFGVIVGALPDFSFANDDRSFLLQPGTRATMKKDPLHGQILKGTERAGGAIDWSNNRPADGTALERGWTFETGAAMLIDPYQVSIRINELCGLFLNFFDSHTRLAGLNLNIESWASQQAERNDEGETSIHRQEFLYPWEAVGAYTSASTAPMFTENDPKEVQYDTAKHYVDLKPPYDVQPVARYQEYGGYLGQGHMRFLMVPTKSYGIRHYSDEDPDLGLWVESISADGTYTNRSAKSVIIAKYPANVVPRRKRLPEDQKQGDSPDNYKASSQSGEGPGHKIGDVTVNDDPQHITRIVGILDLLAYQFNYKDIVGFVNHTEDFNTPEQSELAPLDHTIEKINFGALTVSDYLPQPQPQRVHIDHRYGNVNYYNRTSFLALLEDGSVCLADGYGSRISLVGGEISIEAPGNIKLQGGKAVITMTGDVITRAKGCVDVSATDGDIRHKAQRNYQICAGNGGTGGVLIESKSTSSGHVYDGKVGEDVIGAGIVLLAKNSDVGLLGADIYLRTGGPGLKAGTINLDASQGQRGIYMNSRNVDCFTDAFMIWHGEAFHRFADDVSLIAGSLTVDRTITSLNGGVYCKKGMGAGESIFTKGNLSQKNTKGHVGISKDIDLTEFLKPYEENREKLRGVYPDIKKSFTDRWHTPENVLGNAQLLEAMGFSFRDPDGEPAQYRTQELKFAQVLWHQMVSQGSGSGGRPWIEKPVINNHMQTYPWPGKKAWTIDKAYVCAPTTSTLTDLVAGRAADRTKRDGTIEDIYLTPALNGLETKPMEGSYLLIQ